MRASLIADSLITTELVRGSETNSRFVIRISFVIPSFVIPSFVIPSFVIPSFVIPSFVIRHYPSARRQPHHRFFRQLFPPQFAGDSSFVHHERAVGHAQDFFHFAGDK